MARTDGRNPKRFSSRKERIHTPCLEKESPDGYPADLADNAIKKAIDSGADYAEARLQTGAGSFVLVKNGENGMPGFYYSNGIGIRIGYRGALVFTATGRLEKGHIESVVEKSIKVAKGQSKLFAKKVVFSKEKPAKAKWGVKEKQKYEDLTIDELWQIVKEADRATMDTGKEKLSYRVLYISSSLELTYITTSEGISISGRVPSYSINGVLTGMEGTRSVQRDLHLGRSGGSEAIEKTDFRNVLTNEAKTLLRILKEAKAMKEEKTTLLAGPEVAGIMAHESVGHPQEADRVLGREAAQAGESYLLPEDLGKKIGSEEANVSDDPTVEGSYGFYLYDAEGVKGCKRELLKEGRVNELLHNRETSAELNTRSNGSARAAGYDMEPIVRMANTYVEPGDYSEDELIEDIKNGVYMKSFMEWNIDDKRLNQRYVGHEAYRVVKGELRERILNPVLEITTPVLWSSVAARGRRVEWNAATCGKGDPLQGVPVWTGGPMMLIKDMRLQGFGS